MKVAKGAISHDIFERLTRAELEMEDELRQVCVFLKKGQCILWE